MGASLRIRVYQFAIVTLTLLLALLFVHWFVTQPAQVIPGKRDLTWWATLMFWRAIPWSGYSQFFSVTLGLMATTALAACALAAMLAIRVPDHISARRLAWALVGASFAAGYIYFVTAHAQYRAVIGWTPTSPIRLVWDLLAYSAGLLSPLLLARFFLSYPRTVLPDEWGAESLRYFKHARDAIQSQGNWRSWLYPSSLRTRMSKPSGKSRWLNFTSDAEMAKKESRLVGAVQSSKAVPVLILWAVLCAVLDGLDARQAASTTSAGPTLLNGAKIAASILWIMMPILAWEIASKSLRIYAVSAMPDDRRKVDWIKSTLFVGGVLVVCVQFGGWVFMGFLASWLDGKDIFLPSQILVFGPLFAAVQLLALAFVVSLAFSIFYRGAIDPRLAARKITFFGVLGMAVAVLFVFFERIVAFKIIAFFNLSPETGALIAGGAVAATVAPIKNHAEKSINNFVGRFLPLETIIEGERRNVVIALSDLSGYTLLSSRDEKQAMLLAALLQRQAGKLTKVHGGRVVKSMGDAVMFAFDDAPTAAKVLAALHRDFAPAAEQFGLTALQVHSGAHMGEVTIAHDGDVYGQTVNIAARIQGGAAPGQIVVSETFAVSAKSAAYRDLGPQKFKNVPEAISCLELLSSAPQIGSVAAAG